jgi:hypothetical protein
MQAPGISIGIHQQRAVHSGLLQQPVGGYSVIVGVAKVFDPGAVGSVVSDHDGETRGVISGAHIGGEKQPKHEN